MFQTWAFPMNLRILIAAALAVLTLGVPVWSHEGHDHGAPPPAAAAKAAPRTEAQSALFEMVAVSRGASLEIHLDRFDTNEPVTGATIEVETPAGPSRAAVDGGRLPPRRALAGQPATYDLIATVMSGADVDFLTATLTIPEAPAPVVATSSGWLVGSALATEMREVLSVDLKTGCRANDPGHPGRRHARLRARALRDGDLPPQGSRPRRRGGRTRSPVRRILSRRSRRPADPGGRDAGHSRSACPTAPCSCLNRPNGSLPSARS